MSAIGKIDISSSRSNYPHYTETFWLTTRVKNPGIFILFFFLHMAITRCKYEICTKTEPTLA